MKLSNEDTDLFYELMRSLQLFVNQQLNLIPKVTTVEDYRKLPQSQMMRIRKALYDNAKLVDRFVEMNPQHFSLANLGIVESWKRFIGGNFFIERLLKKYAIFIQDQRVYGVLALYDSFEDVLTPSLPPVYVKATLLPFKDKIIYDGLIESYNVYLGSGISSNLKETYLRAKQNGTVIESLDSQHQFAEQRKQSRRNWLPEVDDLLAKAKRLQANAGDPVMISPAFTLTKASIELTKTLVANPEDLDTLRIALKKVQKAIRKVEITLLRIEP